MLVNIHMKKNILLVDDDLDLSKSVVNYLSNEGFNVVFKNTAQQALQALQDEHFDLIITDIVMPSLDGYDLIKLLRLDSSFSCIPIIFLTAKGMTHDRVKGYNLGCNAYLVKPFSPLELLSIVRNLLKNFDLMIKTNLVNQDSSYTKQQNFVLTRKELEVFQLVYQGLMNKEIAAKLQLSLRTVEKYVSRLFLKTNTKSRTQLVKFAAVNNFLKNRANDGIRTRE
uniref:TctD-like protein n=2 Tax=Gelidium TaxID=2811 RepID=A0A411FT09_9FLOR|nr:hypothetical protein [Gelidium coulteri]YP_009565326.1 hypothetical protein [Gelidium sinicola]QBA96277.1 hypothetical protein [Gelidium coulteri]QBA96677.1 hypothetical protein [Gelidium sinicola]